MRDAAQDGVQIPEYVRRQIHSSCTQVREGERRPVRTETALHLQESLMLKDDNRHRVICARQSVQVLSRYMLDAGNQLFLEIAPADHS